jgi:hypothetical protein
MMLRRCLVLLIVLGTLESALACDFTSSEPQEIKVEVIEGLGGDCYYKRIPQPEQTENWTNQELWRTEFFTNQDAEVPAFVINDNFRSKIICNEDKQGSEHMSYVVIDNTKDISDKSWLQVVVDSNVVASYAPIDIIQRPENYSRIYACGSSKRIYLNLTYGTYIKDDTSNTYFYQVETLDKHLVNFDLVTGEKLIPEQPLGALFMDAIRIGSLAEVQSLIDQGANPNTGNMIDGTPLHLASKLGSIEIVNALIESGARVGNYATSVLTIDDNGEDAGGHAPLFVAAENGHLEVVELLLSHGANINQRGFEYESLLSITADALTVLEVAIVNNHVEVAAYIVEQGAEITSITLEIAKYTKNAEIMELVSSHTPR